MSAFPIAQSSTWPLALMLDELSLKVRREFVHHMESRGILLPKETSRTILRERRAHGKVLQREILIPVLGAQDYAFLNSESVFGVSNYALRSSIPVVLAFGYDMGLGVSRFRGTGAHHQNAARLCALFNLGISVFDHACDNLEDGTEELARSFDESTMHVLIDDPSGWVTFLETSQHLPSREIRILLKIVCAFYSHLHKWARVDRDSDVWKHLATLLVDAYHAELRSTRFHSSAYPTAILATAAERKSTLPFDITLQISRVCGANSTRDENVAACDLVSDMGKVFWLIDDLADVVRDIKSRDMNVILFRASGSSGSGQWPAETELARRLLEEKYIDDAIDSLSEHFTSIVGSLRSPDGPADPNCEFLNLILAYARNWGE